MLSPKPNLRRGHTLVELVTASVSSAMLLAGLGSVMMIANQVANTPAASADRVAAAAVVDELANDLRFATFIVERSLHVSDFPQVLDFVVADRNGDGAAERIRYEWTNEWSDVSDKRHLYKTVNGGSRRLLLEDVQDFQQTLSTVGELSSYAATTESAETVIAGYTASPAGAAYNISQDTFLAQQIDPPSVSAIPAGATSWNATKVVFLGQRTGSGETMRVQIRSAGEPAGRPTGEVLGEEPVLEDHLTSGIGWNTVTFESPVRGLAMHRPYSLVWRGTTGESGNAGSVLKDAGVTTGVSESADAGANWEFRSGQRVFYRIHGTYTSPAAAIPVTRNYATRVSVSLQSGDAAHSRINTSVPLLNRPELLSAYWRADFETDPTTLDMTRDGANDWTMAGGGAFNASTLVDGFWLSNGSLESRPKLNFTAVTTVDVRCRNSTVGGNGAELRIQVDRQAGSHAPLIVRVQQQPDTSQTLTLYGKENDADEEVLFQRKNLSSDFVRYRLTILPANNLVNLAINDQDEGTYEYPTYPPSNDDRFLTFCNSTSNAEFDYVELRVAE